MAPKKKNKKEANAAPAPAAKKAKKEERVGEIEEAPAPASESDEKAPDDADDLDDDDLDDDDYENPDDDLEGLVGELLNGEIEDEDAEDGGTHGAVDALRAGFQPIVVEDPRPAKDCEDGFAHAEAGNAEELMQWLIAPYSLDDFMRLTWERRPLYVSRNANKKYLDGWLSKEDVDGWLRAGKMRYGVNVDVTSYVNGVRETHNINDDDADDEEPWFADAASVWKKFDEKGCSLRILHPQRWKDALWKMLSTMERYWNCSTGCNVYLTPPNSQGFSPHFDDIDAFVLQLEGKKTWRVYPPRSEKEMLPRYSSPNFAQDEIGEPVLEVILEPGDVLYMPRGTVHQASCVDGEHSLHVTLSTNQFNTWADALELALPAAIRDAVAELPALRRCPPPDMLQRLGIGASDDGDGSDGGGGDRRDAFVGALNELASAVLRRLPLDAAADQLGARLMKQRLPPPPSHLATPKAASGPDAAKKVTMDSVVRLTAEGGARVVVDGDGEDVFGDGEARVTVYHLHKNGRKLHMEGGDGEGDGDDEEPWDGEDNDHAGDGGAKAWVECDDYEPGMMLFSANAGPALEILLHSEDAAETGVAVRDLEKIECTVCSRSHDNFIEPGLDVASGRDTLIAVRRLVCQGVLAVVS